MARETRIGMVVMVLMVGAFGFLVYQRWNSQQPTALAYAAELQEEMSAQRDEEADPGEETPSADRQAAADSKTSTSASPPAPKAKKEGRVAHEETEVAPAAPPLNNPFAGAGGKPGSNSAQSETKPATGAEAPAPSSPNPFATGAMVSLARPPEAKPHSEAAGSDQPASEVPPARMDAKGGGSSPGDRPSTHAHDHDHAHDHGAKAPTNGQKPSAASAPAGAASSSPFSGIEKSGRGAASPAMPGLAEADATPFGSSSLAGAKEEPGKTPKRPAGNKASPFGASPPEKADQADAPDEPVVAETPTGKQPSDPFAALGNAASASPEPAATEPAGPVTLKADPFAGVAGKMAGDKSNATSEATQEPSEATKEESAPPFSPPRSAGTSPAESGGAAAASPKMADSPFGPRPKTSPPAKTQSHEEKLAPSPPEATGAKRNSSQRTYAVKKNDNFWSISEAVYGSPIYAHALAYHNAERVEDPRNLRPGTSIVTPAVEVLRTQYHALIATGSRAAARSGRKSGFFVTETGAPAYRVTGDVSGKETLQKIAEAHLARSARWIQIFEMNRDLLQTPDDLAAGMVLALPVDASRVRLVPAGDGKSPPTGATRGGSP